MFNFWDEYKKDHEKAVNFYTTWTVAYATFRALAMRLGLCETTKDIFGIWGLEGFACGAISFLLIAPYIRTYFKSRASQ